MEHDGTQGLTFHLSATAGPRDGHHGRNWLGLARAPPRQSVLLQVVIFVLVLL